MNEKRFISEPVELEVRDLGEGKTAEYISGYGIVFNKWSSTLMMKRDNGQVIEFVEMIEPRAIEGVNMDNAVSMVDHSITLGKRNKGTMDITIDENGVRYSTRIPNTTAGNDARENIKNGNLEGSSFQFGLAKGGDKWDTSVTPFQRTITKFSSVVEMGPVTRPAYPDTTAAMRSLDFVEKEVKETDNVELEKRLKRLVQKYNYSKLKTAYNKNEK